jgi:threonine dehydrogenase-like Zn-dependent dehydrogenase
MTTKAVRIHGVNDLRLEELELPAAMSDEILARIVSDSICMSSHKLAMQGDRHKRVRPPLAKSPAIIGHEPCGEILEVGAKWKDRYRVGQKFVIQPALNYRGTPFAPGYSYGFMGGDATYVIIPNEVMEMGCLLEYKAPGFFLGSLAEPLSCVISAFHAQYHTREGFSVHDMGIVEGGSLALLGSAGPMGLAAIDYALHADARPSRVVVTDIDQARLERAARVFTVEEARHNGVDLVYANTEKVVESAGYLQGLNGGRKFDDVFVFAPVRSLVETGDRLLARDGCLSFFAGPTDASFSAPINLYDVHYDSHHIVGTSGGTADDVKESLALIADGRLNPSAMITHVGGLNAVPAATIGLDKIPGGKKLIYTHKKLDLVAIADFEERGKADPYYAELARLVRENNMVWSAQAEDFLLANAPGI